MVASLDNKLFHLSTGERNDVAKLQEFAHLFPDIAIPKKTKIVRHDVEAHAVSSIHIR